MQNKALTVKERKIKYAALKRNRAAPSVFPRPPVHFDGVTTDRVTTVVLHGYVGNVEFPLLVLCRAMCGERGNDLFSGLQ